MFMGKIGLQLFSIRELLSDDFAGTLEKVGKIGYEGVEFAGYYNIPAKEMKKILDDTNLKAAGSHVGIDDLKNSLDRVIEYNLEIGNKNIVCPWLPVEMRDSADAYKKTADLFNKIGDKCKSNGLQFGYHNHEFELEKFDGIYGLDILVSNTQPELLHMELDTFFFDYCGLKAVNFIEKYGERCSLLHIKDMKSKEEKVSTIVGSGTIDFTEVLSLGSKLNTTWYIVEQEEFEKSQLQSIEESFSNLKNIMAKIK